jgi:hypothetical protein
MKSTKQHPKSWLNQGNGISISHLNVQVFGRNKSRASRETVRAQPVEIVCPNATRRATSRGVSAFGMVPRRLAPQLGKFLKCDLPGGRQIAIKIYAK